MANPIHLTIAIFNHGQWDALRDGRVSPDGIELEHIPVPSPYRPMVRELAFDIAEVALTTFACAKSFDIPITAIPIFSNRDVTMSPIVYNVNSGIKTPKDLEGKRVGLRSFTVTNNTQCRAFLTTEFGVDTTKVHWVVTEDAHVAQYKEPSYVEYAPEGRKLEDMLVAGEIDAGIQLSIKPEGDIQPLLTEEQANDVGLGYFRRTGVYPIGHVMTIKDSVLAEHPEVATEMFRTFKASKDVYLQEVDSRDPQTTRDKQTIRNRDLVGGDPFPMGLAQNRKAMEAMLDMYRAQQVIPGVMDVDGLFAANTLGLE
jgi:4,5-dihydroxyphthalate decarboxylase